MHHCKIFWFRRRNKRESGGKHHVEEKDCRYQVKHCDDSQQVRKYAESGQDQVNQYSNHLWASPEQTTEDKCQNKWFLRLPPVMFITIAGNKSLFLQLLPRSPNIQLYRLLWYDPNISNNWSKTWCTQNISFTFLLFMGKFSFFMGKISCHDPSYLRGGRRVDVRHTL